MDKPSQPSESASTSTHSAAFEDEIFHERYLLGRLDADEAERFERHYLDCASCLERLETVQALLDTMRRTAVEDATQRLQAGLWGLLRRRLLVVRRPLVALASLALLMLGGWGAWHLVDQSRRLEALSTRLSDLQASAQSPLRITLSPWRGGSAASAESRRRLTLPPTPQWLQLELDLGLTPEAVFDLAYEQAGGVVWQRRTLRADAAGGLTLLVLSDALPGGEGELSVRAAGLPPDGSVVARFPLEVQATAP